MGFEIPAHDAEPGGVLLFRRLSGSTIGAAWFHGRVRDGIGWGTGAMTTKLGIMCWEISIDTPAEILQCSAVVDDGTLRCEQSN